MEIRKTMSSMVDNVILGGSVYVYRVVLGGLGTCVSPFLYLTAQSFSSSRFSKTGAGLGRGVSGELVVTSSEINY